LAVARPQSRQSPDLDGHEMCAAWWPRYEVAPRGNGTPESARSHLKRHDAGKGAIVGFLAADRQIPNPKRPCRLPQSSTSSTTCGSVSRVSRPRPREIPRNSYSGSRAREVPPRSSARRSSVCFALTAAGSIIAFSDSDNVQLANSPERPPRDSLLPLGGLPDTTVSLREHGRRHFADSIDLGDAVFYQLRRLEGAIRFKPVIGGHQLGEKAGRLRLIFRPLKRPDLLAGGNLSRDSQGS